MHRRLALAAGCLLALTACAGGGRGANGVAGSTGSAGATTTGPTSTTAVAPATAGSPDVIAGFVAFGDFGGGPAQAAVAAAMERWATAHRVDALVTTGDNVYDTGDPSRFPAQLDRPYAALRRTRPLWVTLGNHDEAAGHGAQELAHLGLPPLPYQRDLPGLRLLFVDANHPDAAQAAWLDDHLAAAGPAFRVVVFHQPAWSCGLHGSTAAVDQRWVPVLERRRVALVLNGHDHDYERFVSAGDVAYVVTGGGGQSLYPLIPNCPTGAHEQASAIRHHFVGVEIGEHTLALTAVADDGTVLDRAVIRR